MTFSLLSYLVIFTVVSYSLNPIYVYACSNNEKREVKEFVIGSCPKCEEGFYCYDCLAGLKAPKCVRSVTTNPFQLVNNSVPFNKFAFLTTHNAFAIDGEPSHTKVPRITLPSQEDNITQQLQNGVRALMLDTYDFEGDIWLCHSFNGICHDFTAFEPALDTLKEIEAFLSSNSKEIVTLILEDYVKAPNGLTNVFKKAGLMKYWVPISSMPKQGQDWPLVKDMVSKNQRLLVFTSKRYKQQSEGIAYQWNYMVENQYGDAGMKEGNCINRGESSPLNDTSKSLVLVNYIRSVPWKELSCVDNSNNLMNMLRTCHGVAGNRWANFVAVDYYKRGAAAPGSPPVFALTLNQLSSQIMRSEGGGAFQALDMLNGELLCAHDDVHACATHPSGDVTV